MKKSLIFAFLLFALPLASAVNININSNYKPGETLLGTVEGNFLSPLTAENFYFYSGRVQMPLIFDVAKIQDKYYFYAILPVEERNYTLVLKNLDYFENGKEISGDLEKNFSVSGSVIDFSISPGFVIMNNETTISLKSENSLLNVSINFLNYSDAVSVPVAQEKKVSLNSGGILGFLFTHLDVSALNTKYSIPVAILSPSSNVTNASLTGGLDFSRSEFDFSVHKGNETGFSIYLENLGSGSVQNITLNFSDVLQDVLAISPSEIDEIKEHGNQKIDLTVNTREIKTYRGLITAYSGNISTESLIIINSLEENETLPLPTPSEPIGKQGCSSMGGLICAGQTCTGVTADSFEGPCCMGTCGQATSYTGTIVGIVLLLGIAGGLYYLYHRYKKKKMNPDEILRKSEKNFEERMNPGKEVRGGLIKS
jgi:hypothetical protein